MTDSDIAIPSALATIEMPILRAANARSVAKANSTAPNRNDDEMTNLAKNVSQAEITRDSDLAAPRTARSYR